MINVHIYALMVNAMHLYEQIYCVRAISHRKVVGTQHLCQLLSPCILCTQQQAVCQQPVIHILSPGLRASIRSQPRELWPRPNHLIINLVLCGAFLRRVLPPADRSDSYPGDNVDSNSNNACLISSSACNMHTCASDQAPIGKIHLWHEGNFFHIWGLMLPSL